MKERKSEIYTSNSEILFQMALLQLLILNLAQLMLIYGMWIGHISEGFFIMSFDSLALMYIIIILKWDILGKVRLLCASRQSSYLRKYLAYFQSSVYKVLGCIVMKQWSKIRLGDQKIKILILMCGNLVQWHIWRFYLFR